MDEKDLYILKLESLVMDMAKSCLCERQTEGFNYHETHKKLGKGSGRWKTPNDLLDSRIGFEWRYEKPEGCSNSWKFYKFKFLEQNEGFK